MIILGVLTGALLALFCVAIGVGISDPDRHDRE